MTVGEAFQAIVRDTLEHLLRNQPPTLAGYPEGIHQTRVAMRRLRAALQAFKRLLPYRERKAFNGDSAGSSSASRRPATGTCS